jgi:hypothetical protein
LKQCAWRARTARFVALKMLGNWLENQHQQHVPDHIQRSSDDVGLLIPEPLDTNEQVPFQLKHALFYR